MASAIGSALISTILEPMAAKAMEKVEAMEGNNVDGIVNIKRDISKLQETLYTIKGIVQVAEEKQIDEQGKPEIFIQKWLRNLVDIGYDARDVLDDFITFSSCVIRAEEASNPVNFISSFMPSDFGGSSSDTSNIPLTVLNRLEKGIRSFTEKFDVEVKKSEKFNTSISVVGGGGGGSENVKNRRPEVGPDDNKQGDGLFLGREDVKKGIMKKILEPKYDRVDVVVIWGMGGIGKTTLARSIYNDESVKKVPRISWSCVAGRKFRAEKVIREILNDKKTFGITNLQTKLKDELKGGRFLIVLDDVWDVDGSEWNLLFNPLTKVGKGGMIIITRRNREVCPELKNIQEEYNLEPLSEEDAWSIFESCAYVNGNSDSTPELKSIGKKIVKKLNGHPLALKVVGRSLLHKDSSTWTDFLESKFSKDKDNEVMSALRWSYNHLPLHLKACFTFCSLFPKDHVLDKKLLVEMWMAHDLIQKDEQKRPEDVGAQYFEKLANASLLQCVDGTYVMHDLIHDLALHVSNGEFATDQMESLTNDQMKQVRHVTITRSQYSKVPRLCKMEKLLTLYTTDTSYKIYDSVFKQLDDVFKQLKSIRVLVLSDLYIREIPDCISELTHLRYLDVSDTGVTSLPDSLCHLYNLQMLAAPTHAVLPRDVVNMVNLRYIRANLSTCKGVGKLTSLQELSSIRVCQGDNIRELGGMKKLRGKLRIVGLGNVTSSEYAAGALMEKQTLMDTLKLKFDKHLGESTISEEVLDVLGCPANLTNLQIDGYNGLKPPSWMVDGKHKFHKLQKLLLYNCPKLESLLLLGELTFLKHILLKNVGIKRLGEEFYGKFTYGKVFFLSLESLCFSFMKELEEWDDIIIENSCVSFFPLLTSLEVEECPKLVSLLPVVKNCTSKRKMNATNFMTSLSNLRISKCDGLKRLQLDALVSLKNLDIHSCKSLVQITSAICESLEISSCRLLEKMNVARCDSQQLVIKIVRLLGCESLRSLSIDIHGLDFLEKLIINCCPTLELAFEDGSSSSSSSGNSVAVPIHNISTDSTQVFRSLLHHELRSLESLHITNLRGFENFDETEANNFCKSRSLKSLRIWHCEDLKSLPPDFHKLSSLSSLEINDCNGLKRLKLDALVSLKELVIRRCECLVQITCAICESLHISSCRLLEKMDIARCDSLVVIKILELIVGGCESLRSLSIDIHGLDSLEDLSIHGCPKLELTFEDRSSSPSSSGNSVAVPIHNISTDTKQVFRTLLHHELRSLESLDIRNLRGFENFDETEANNFCKSRSLKSLQISDCKDLKSLPPDFHKLSSLGKLSIYSCPQLQSLPQDFHKLSSLSSLVMMNCNGLKRLKLDALVSLKDLVIMTCESLVQITSAICESLYISSCRLLEKMDVARCDSQQVVIKILKLFGCESLRSLSIDIHGLDCLEDLSIHGCPKLELAFEDRSSSPSSSGNSVAVPIHNISTDNKQVKISVDRQIKINVDRQIKINVER